MSLQGSIYPYPEAKGNSPKGQKFEAKEEEEKKNKKSLVEGNTFYEVLFCTRKA